MSKAGRSGSIPPGNILKISPVELGRRRRGHTRKRWRRAPSWCSYATTQRKFFARTFSLRLKNCPRGPDAKRAESALPTSADDRALVLGRPRLFTPPLHLAVDQLHQTIRLGGIFQNHSQKDANYKIRLRSRLQLSTPSTRRSA